ncbi:flagellar basal-body rod protein FlgB [Formivibrio citricus]|uniref:Flagellar basal body rod protein FlgB n=1 Tax=Formivibrio citricus TaxID=83765 RepID=A0A1I4ZVI8_9NEIS|nr:flagellar basal body rod protein FlgB [Formivibrio citricus]SFN54275.1 flagellar basal-body rod protein FlgB [Formivibrio citricus]
MLGKLDDYFKVQETALKLRSARQELLASNIANADTPNYKARDVNFSAAFSAALEGRQGGDASLAKSHTKHLQGQAGNSIFPSSAVLYRQETQSSVDGNTVNMDTELAAFADNALRYQAALTFMQKRIETMRTAVQGN